MVSYLIIHAKGINSAHTRVNNHSPYTALLEMCLQTVGTFYVLTIMTGGSYVTSITAVTVEGRPGLGTVSSMLTVVWQTPNGRQCKTNKPRCLK